MDERYFGLHHDLMPEAIALQLHGTLVWEREDEGMWIALIRFNRQFEARFALPGDSREDISKGESAVAAAAAAHNL
jgi:hypothetical protein